MLLPQKYFFNWKEMSISYKLSDLRTVLRAISLNLLRSSRHILAASTFAGLSSFGSANIDKTEINIFSILCTGLQRSVLLS